MNRWMHKLNKVTYSGTQCESEEVNWFAVIRDAGIVLLIGAASVMAGCPMYNVWEQGLAGQAELRRAEQNRQIKIQEARAVKESAVMLADAEIERARGVAQANVVIGESLKNNEAYLRYLFIHTLEGTKNQVIYLPTEAGLPILEAKRLGK